jgi:hypothetical protein
VQFQTGIIFGVVLYLIANNSTSKIMVALGGIGPVPNSPYANFDNKKIARICFCNYQ